MRERAEDIFSALRLRQEVEPTLLPLVTMRLSPLPARAQVPWVASSTPRRHDALPLTRGASRSRPL